MKAESVLIVEDEELMRSILRQLVEASGYQAFTADNAENALDIFTSSEIDLTLTDIKMSGRDGLALLDQIKSIDSDAIVIVMTAYSSVDTAVSALRKGAYDYITKPFVNDELLQTVRNALAHRQLFRENRYLRRELNRQSHYPDIVGQSEPLRRVLGLVDKVAATSASVLIEGESGTGKELFARAIHFNSDRSDKPFLAVNCGALSESLLESELFGHMKGSFTGAIADKPGFFRSAAGGTLFLDEIGEMPVALQVKLLRALQEREVLPVGASVPVPFDARIIAATNKKLESEVAEGRFREDLYYRLNVVEIEVPPLRSRSEDIPILVRHFVARSAQNQGVPEKSVTSQAMDSLVSYSWPGNVRELEHAVERAMILSENEIDLDSFSEKIRGNSATAGPDAAVQAGNSTLEEMERRYILQVMSDVENDKAAAAKILGIDLSTLYRKLKRFELS